MKLKKTFFVSLFFLTNLLFAVDPVGICEDYQPKIKQHSLEVLLLISLPASGKSEIRRYFSHLGEERLKEEYGICETVQLDDFPYVHMMRRISDEFTKRGLEGPFFISPALPFKSAKEWETLMHLINEDFEDLIYKKIPDVDSAGEWLLNRLDNARIKAGLDPISFRLPEEREDIVSSIENEAAKILKTKIETITTDLKDKTIIIEFARGGPHASPMPLPAPYGYEFALSKLSSDILEKASILYIWTTPEESRKKNAARADPNDPGSILHHCVPLSVMYGDYGLDDIDYLTKISEVPNTLTIKSDGNTYHIPFGRFDNRTDKTTFLREDPSLWSEENLCELENGLKKAFDALLN